MKKNLKYYLSGTLSKKLLDLVPTSYDVVGDIMILNEFPPELESKESLIGKIILENYHNIKVVAKKTGQYAGTYRTPVLKIIAGERRKKTIHKEAGVLLQLHVQDVYFSARTGNERLRVAKQVKKNEDILVMFSGSGILPLVLAKNTQAKSIVGVEINPKGHEFAQLNNTKNKTTDKITFYGGDVRKVVPKLTQKFDRIVMPLPKDAEQYLDVAFSASKKDTIIHLYQFMTHDKKAQLQVIKDMAVQSKKTIKIKDVVNCGSYAPGVNRVCVEIKVK